MAEYTSKKYNINSLPNLEESDTFIKCYFEGVGESDPFFIGVDSVAFSRCAFKNCLPPNGGVFDNCVYLRDENAGTIAQDWQEGLQSLPEAMRLLFVCWVREALENPLFMFETKSARYPLRIWLKEDYTIADESEKSRYNGTIVRFVGFGINLDGSQTISKLYNAVFVGGALVVTEHTEVV